jgi:hypothetical protein
MSSKKRQTVATEKGPKSQVLIDLGGYETGVVGFADSIFVQPRVDVIEIGFLESANRQKPIMVARFYITRADLAGVWERSRDFYDSMKAMSDRDRWGAYEIGSSLPGGIVGGDSPAPLCSAFAVAKVGEAALIECFYFTATSMHRAGLGVGKPKVVPLFAVQIPAGLIWSFMDKIKELNSAPAETKA